MSDYAVRSNVPLPTPRGQGKRGSKYPFGEMAVGESFVVTDKTARTVRSAVAAYQKKYEAKFAVRTTDEGVGVWRIS